MEVRGCLAVAWGGGRAQGQRWHFIDPARHPSVLGGPSEAKSQNL